MVPGKNFQIIFIYLLGCKSEPNAKATRSNAKVNFNFLEKIF